MLDVFLQNYFQDKELQNIFKDVIGTDNPEKIEPQLKKAIHEHLKEDIQEILFIQSSIGVVFGLLLTNHKKIILKVYSPKITLSYLKEMNRIQDIFYQENFPAPHVLSPIFTLGNTHAGLYLYVDGIKEDAHQDEIRKTLAKTLADFSNIIDQHHLLPLENFFQQASHKKLWPTPHNVLFNLKRSTRGAGWIANKAIKARKILSSSHRPKKLAHTDWGVKNSIFKNKQCVGVLDWDSLGAMSELEMVGRASAQFTADWESPFKITPTPEEGRLFVKEYEEYRGKSFSNDDYQIISASADYLIAIISRFEHAGNNQTIHPYQDLLKLCGDKSFLFA